MFGNLKTEGLEKQEDRLGGGRPMFDTDVYTMQINAVYITRTKKHGMMANLLFTDKDGKEYRESLFIAKALDNDPDKLVNYSEKDGKKIPYAGFTILNDLCLVNLEKTLDALGTEPRTFKIYDADQKKEVAQEVPTIVALNNKIARVAIQKVRQNKTELNKATNEYEDVNSPIEVNRIVKVFHPELGITMAEAYASKREPEFLNQWLEKNKGKTWDRYKEVAGGASEGAPQVGGSAPSGTPSLFG